MASYYLTNRIMKKALLLLSVMAVLASCEREQLVPDSEVPKWLKERIAQDEEILKTSTQSNLGIAAWMRYQYDGSYFFEYLNLISSSFPPVYSFEGVRVMFDQNDYQDYSRNKCCKKYVWKGPDYFEID